MITRTFDSFLWLVIFGSALCLSKAILFWEKNNIAFHFSWFLVWFVVAYAVLSLAGHKGINVSGHLKSMREIAVTSGEMIGAIFVLKGIFWIFGV